MIKENGMSYMQFNLNIITYELKNQNVVTK